jgi:hypothetical protein
MMFLLLLRDAYTWTEGGGICLLDRRRKACIYFCPTKELGEVYSEVMRALFSSKKSAKNFRFLSHRILWHMHGILNIDKNN